MTNIPLRARSASEIVDAAFQIYRQEPLTFILITALAYTPWLLLRLFVAGAVGAVSGIGLAVGAFGSWIGAALMSTALVAMASKLYLGQDPDLGVTVREVLPRVHRVMIAALLKYALLAIGFLFFFVGALYVLARYFAVTPAIVLERTGPLEAFGRSSSLSTGKKRHILNTLLLAGLIYIVIAIAASIPFGFFHSQVVNTVASATVTVVVYPLVGIAEMLIYYDARIRAEGYDIELMAGALAAKPVEEPARYPS